MAKSSKRSIRHCVLVLNSSCENLIDERWDFMLYLICSAVLPIETERRKLRRYLHGRG
jgi:hypothetical protein